MTKKPKPTDEKFVPMATKISPAAAEVWDAICQARQTDTYHMLQNFIYTMIRAAAGPHALNPDIQKILTMLDTDAGWQKAFNLCAPNAKAKVSQVVLIMEQEGRKGFGAVMVNRPFMGDATMTECTDDILERVCEVTMRGIYRRLRLLGARMECNNLSDVLLTLIDSQTILDLAGDVQAEGPQMGDRTDNGREYAYGKRTKQTKRRTPDTLDLQQRITFTDSDRQQADEEVARSSSDKTSGQPDDEPDWRPFGQEW
ncbi:MAG: hypothetical protein IKF14_17135 [Atopobiaceae bacterium]|nr:hypothetical protein [Atopobiaceae bacterium]